MLSAGKRATGKSQSDGKRHPKQEKKNSKNDKRPSDCGRRRLLAWISRRMVRKRNEDKSHYCVKQREKGAKRRQAGHDVVKDRQYSEMLCVLIHSLARTTVDVNRDELHEVI